MIKTVQATEAYYMLVLDQKTLKLFNLVHFGIDRTDYSSWAGPANKRFSAV